MTLSHRHKSALILGLLIVCYLLTIHLPDNFLGTIRLVFLLTGNRWGELSLTSIVWQNFAFYAYLLTPTALLIAAMLAAEKRQSTGLAKVAAITAYTFMVFAFCEIFFAPIIVFMGTEATMATQFIVAISIFSWHWSVLLMARQMRDSPTKRLKMTAKSWLVIAPVLAIMAWSVIAGATAALQSGRIANGQPYCIAHTDFGSPASYGEIENLEILRGVRFHTDKTGYKMNSRFYFHSILIVDRHGDTEFWNWSNTRMKFEKLQHPKRQVVSLNNACKPSKNFITDLPLF